MDLWQNCYGKCNWALPQFINSLNYLAHLMSAIMFLVEMTELTTGLPTKNETVWTAQNTKNVTIWSYFLFVSAFNWAFYWLSKWLSTEISQFRPTRNPECKKTDSTNSVQSSLKSHPLWVTLYFLLQFSTPWIVTADFFQFFISIFRANYSRTLYVSIVCSIILWIMDIMEDC